tara:strand:+ start:57 stop:797 length:741 start_codon:yes stop_codon:yes gene_type:complete
MAEKECPKCPEEGLPGWMGTFADMMTLLMCFFVLLFAMSSLDPVKIQMMQESAQKRLGIKTDSAISNVKVRPTDNKLQIKRKLDKIIEEMDIQEQAKVVSDPRGMAIEFDGSVCFGSGSTSLKPEIKRILDRVIDDLNHPTDKRSILVEGHSDNVAPSGAVAKKYPTNWHLSTARAGQVTQYLIKQGIKPGRLVPAGYAEQWPAKATYSVRQMGKIDKTYIEQANVTADERQANRRIKIVFKTSWK